MRPDWSIETVEEHAKRERDRRDRHQHFDPYDRGYLTYRHWQFAMVIPYEAGSDDASMFSLGRLHASEDHQTGLI